MRRGRTSISAYREAAMIEINTDDKPVIICDSCRQPINDVEEGIVIYSPQVDEGNGTAYKIVHRIECDDKAFPYWKELVIFLDQLHVAVKYKPESL